MTQKAQTSSSAHEEGEDNTMELFFLGFSMMLAMVLLLSKWLHTMPNLKKYLSEPAMVLLIGLIVSAIVHFGLGRSIVNWREIDPGDDYYNTNDDDVNQEQQQQQYDLTQTILSFPSKVFFLGLLPPIMFNSGYQLQREMFFRHIEPISLFSAVGTTLSGLVTGFLLFGIQQLGWMGHSFAPTLMELLTFGALIAATDTVSVLGVLQAKRVDPHLFSLVFGESALNDAVAIVLFRAFADVIDSGVEDAGNALQKLGAFVLKFTTIAIGSPVLGMATAFVTALVFKFADLRQTKMVELCLYLLLMYVPFVLAEVCQLSGIVAIFFAGMSARRYIEPNVADETKTSAETIFHLCAYLAETCIFLELGLSVFGLTGSFEWRFTLFAFSAALLGRASSIYPLSMLFNLSLKERVLIDDPQLLSHAMGTESCDDDDESSMGSTASTPSQGSGSLGNRSQRKKRKTPNKRRDKKIPLRFMHLLWFAGLRGAVAYACARDFPDKNGHKDEITFTTMVIVFVTVVLMGGATDPLLTCLDIRMNVDERKYMKQWRRERKLKGWYHDLEYKYLYRIAVRADNSEGEREHEMTEQRGKGSHDEAVNRTQDYTAPIDKKKGSQQQLIIHVAGHEATSYDLMEDRYSPVEPQPPAKASGLAPKKTNVAPIEVC